jgi:hypothetical protein
VGTNLKNQEMENEKNIKLPAEESMEIMVVLGCVINSKNPTFDNAFLIDIKHKIAEQLSEQMTFDEAYETRHIMNVRDILNPNQTLTTMENEMNEEYEQAKKRGGLDYADGYIEGLTDSQDQLAILQNLLPRDENKQCATMLVWLIRMSEAKRNWFIDDLRVRYPDQALQARVRELIPYARHKNDCGVRRTGHYTICVECGLEYGDHRHNDDSCPQGDTFHPTNRFRAAENKCTCGC